MKYGNPDKNQHEIVQTLRATGAEVQILTAVGGGFPDLLVSRSGAMALMEIKAEKYADLNDDQRDWHDRWKARIYIVRNVDEALKAIGDAVRRHGGKR